MRFPKVASPRLFGRPQPDASEVTSLGSMAVSLTPLEPSFYGAKMVANTKAAKR
jgi:hypothetical protein